MKFPTAEALIEYARVQVPFYRERYKGLAMGLQLTDAPVVERDEYWSAKDSDPLCTLAGPHCDGYVWSTSGTTSKRRRFVEVSAEDFVEEGRNDAKVFPLEAGDRVVNLFTAADLSGSYAMSSAALELLGCLQISLLSMPDIDEQASHCQALRPTAMIGFAARVLKLARALRGSPAAQGIRFVGFAGEMLSAAAHSEIQAALPNARIDGVAYGAVDVGVFGAPCGDAPIYRVNQEEFVIELQDVDTGEFITEPGRPGRVVATNLTRSLGPVIRLVVGDIACWVPRGSGSHLKLMGRSSGVMRLSPHCDIVYSDLAYILGELPGAVLPPQCVLSSDEARDVLELRVAVGNAVSSEQILEALLPALETKMHPTSFANLTVEPKESEAVLLRVRVVEADELRLNASAKVVPVLDERRAALGN